jgi:hypothetical protein
MLHSSAAPWAFLQLGKAAAAAAAAAAAILKGRHVGPLTGYLKLVSGLLMVM